MEGKIEFLALLERDRIPEAIKFLHSVDNERELFLAALGDYFLCRGDLESAERSYSLSLNFKSNPAAFFGLGEVLLKRGMMKESVSFFLKSAEKESHRVNSLLKIGLAERLLGNIKASLSAYLLAQKHGYDKFVLDINLAVLFSDLGENDKAESCYESAMSKAPEDDRVRFNYSLHLLSKAEFRRGFELYESRPWCARGLGNEWSGEPGRSVLILAEQGYGDLVQFSRFIPCVRNISERVCLACDPKLSGLLSSLEGVDEIVGLDEASIRIASSNYPDYCRVMSIPHIMSLDIQSSAMKFLKPHDGRISFWRGRMEEDEKLKVGLCWQGGKRDHFEMMFNDRKRSIDLELMQPVLDVEGVSFYSLQKDWKEPHPKIMDLMGDCGDFLDTASMISNLDLVISVDTAVAHVAGSVGVPVWMLSRLGGCWRWGLTGSETFWYPTMKIYRQEKMDDWGSAIDHVKESLAGLVLSR